MLLSMDKEGGESDRNYRDSEKNDIDMELRPLCSVGHSGNGMHKPCHFGIKCDNKTTETVDDIINPTRTKTGNKAKWPYRAYDRKTDSCFTVAVYVAWHSDNSVLRMMPEPMQNVSEIAQIIRLQRSSLVSF